MSKPGLSSLSHEETLGPNRDSIKNSAKETVNHPDHYSLLPAVCDKCGDSIECIEVVRHKNFNIGNAIKYLWRVGFKGDPIEDLRKAIWYIEDEIRQLEKERGIGYEK